jgi:hypothetical protein
MPALYPVPKPGTIEDLLNGLVADPLQVERAEVPDPERDATGVFAEFVTESGELAAIGYADPAVVNTVGGAMMDLDPAATAEASRKAALVDEGVEGFREVANILASCLNSDFTRHLRLGNLRSLPGPLTDEVKQLWRQPRARRAYAISVEGEPIGTLILYLN